METTFRSFRRSVSGKNTGVLMAQQQKQDPTPAEIKERCLQIKATWPPDERHRRLRVDQRPMVRCADWRPVAVTAGDYETHHIRTGPRLVGSFRRSALRVSPTGVDIFRRPISETGVVVSHLGSDQCQ